MMDIGRTTTAGFDRTRFPVRYYRVDFSQAQQVSRDSADPRSASFCRDVSECGSMFQILVQEVRFSSVDRSNELMTFFFLTKTEQLEWHGMCNSVAGTKDWGQIAVACRGDDGW